MKGGWETIWAHIRPGLVTREGKEHDHHGEA